MRVVLGFVTLMYVKEQRYIVCHPMKNIGDDNGNSNIKNKS
jgi:hypothetical protein